MSGTMKKGVGLLLVLFLAWFLFTDPNGLAVLARDAVVWLWDLLVQLFRALTRFLTAIFNG